MTYEIKFFVGTGFSKLGVPLANVPERVTLAEQHVCDVFGGVTRYDHVGSWVESPGTPAVSESGVTLVAVVSQDKLGLVRETAQYLKGLFDQNCVLVTRSVVESEFV